MYGDINIDLDDKEVEAFLSRLHKVLLLKAVDNLTSVELEPDSESEEEIEERAWPGCLPGEDRYCTACSVQLIVGTNITENRLAKRYYLCLPCTSVYKRGNADGLLITDIFPHSRHCFMCSDMLENKNWNGTHYLCTGCREDIRQRWFDSEHKCIHCADVLKRGTNWYESGYRSRIHVCKYCKTELARAAKRRLANQN
jgi:hypothetical protein